jgi:hypothetical protein
MADKYIRLNNGVPTETEATTQSTGATEAGKIIAANANGQLDESFLPPGIGADVAIIQASENLSAGDLVSVFDDAGTFKVRKADASTTGKRADGFVLASVTSGQNATVYAEGTIVGLTGVTAGKLYLSDTTPGGFSATPPVGAGKIVQCIGFGTSATTINFDRGEIYVLA